MEHNSKFDNALKSLSLSRSCAEIARWLHEVVDIILDFDIGMWRGLLFELKDAIVPLAFLKFSDHRVHARKGSYYIASGIEADFMYFAFELDIAVSSNLRDALAKLDYLASKFEDANESAIEGIHYAREIYDYCEEEFGFLPKMNNYDQILLVLPDVDIECIAESLPYDNSTFVMVVNANHSTLEILESFAYESVALTIASENIPKEGIKLLSETTSPDINHLSADERFWDYLAAIKSGLSYRGPYRNAQDEVSHCKQHREKWHDYIRKLLQDS